MKYLIREVCNYEVEAENAQAALDKFMNADNPNIFFESCEERMIEGPDCPSTEADTVVDA